MIDFRKELAKFDFVTVDADFTRCINEAAQVVEVFNSTLKRIGKELNNANIQLEEVLSQFSDEQAKDNQLADMKKDLTACIDEKYSLVQHIKY